MTAGGEAERLAAGMLCCGFDSRDLDPHARGLLDRGVRHLVHFARNVDTPAQVRELNLAAKAYAPGVMCYVDQEGGRVARLRDGFAAVPPMREVTDPAEAGDRLGIECRAVGYDVNFAPVVDVDTNPANPVIGDRSFGRDPHDVADKAAACIRAMQRHVAACAKHFPGHGDTDTDSHLDLPRLPHDLARLEAVELVPFRAAVEAGVAMVMTAHIVFEPLDDRPATLSPRVLGLLRDTLGFEGVIASDDFEMKALAGRFDFEASVKASVLAGVDLILVCHAEALQHRAIDAIATLPLARLREANARLDKLRRTYARPPGDLAALRPTAATRQQDPTESWRA